MPGQGRRGRHCRGSSRHVRGRSELGSGNKTFSADSPVHVDLRQPTLEIEDFSVIEVSGRTFLWLLVFLVYVFVRVGLLVSDGSVDVLECTSEDFSVNFLYIVIAVVVRIGQTESALRKPEAQSIGRRVVVSCNVSLEERGDAYGQTVRSSARKSIEKGDRG